MCLMAEKRKREEPLILFEPLSGEAVTEIEVKLDRALMIKNDASWTSLKTLLNTEHDADFEEYAWFMSCKIGFNDLASSALFVPSKEIDKVWHMHIKHDIRAYVEWCWTLCTAVINHKAITDTALLRQGHQNYKKTLEVLRGRQEMQRVVAVGPAGSAATSVAAETSVAAGTAGSAATAVAEGTDRDLGPEEDDPDDSELGPEEDSSGNDPDLGPEEDEESSDSQTMCG